VIYPENFLEWEWRVDSGGANGTFNVLLDRADARVWRLYAVGQAPGGNVNISIGAPNPTNNIILVATGTTITLEPRGMLAGGNGFAINFDAGILFWVVEWIRKVQ
jgi:hypothetical protein